MSAISTQKSHAARFLAALAGAALSLTAVAEQRVYLNFGSTTTAAAKTNQDIYNNAGAVIVTLKKGPRLGLVPTDLGFPADTDRAMMIQMIVDGVRADYTDAGMPYNITFHTTPPAEPYTTINIVSGGFPNFNVPLAPGVTLHFDLGLGRATINGGDQNGYYINLTTGQLFRPNNTQVPGARYPEVVALGSPESVLGIAQQVDQGNKDPNKQAWVFVGSHGAGAGGLTAEQRKAELINTISHELGHLCGLTHADGTAADCMDGAYDGTDKGFNDTCKNKLKAALAPKAPVAPSQRSAQSGDQDQGGKSKPVPSGSTAPDERAKDAVKGLRRALVPHMADEIILPVFEPTFVDPTDPPGMDVPLPIGAVLEVPIQLEELGLRSTLHGAFLEIDIMNLADVDGDPGTRLFIDDFEVPGAFDGIDQRIFSVPGDYARLERVTFFLDDIFPRPILDSMFADGRLDLRFVIGGATRAVIVDSVFLYVSDVNLCIADFNNSGEVTVQDLFDFFAAYFAGDPRADVNNDGTLAVQDIFDYLALYFAGCD
ncbi:MAG: GC-type dockerin domain-anchored protein [Phycisphaerales bacterium]